MMLALNLQAAVLERAAGAALRLELAEQFGQIVALGGQAADDRDDLALLSFLDRQASRLLIRRNARRELAADRRSPPPACRSGRTSAA